MAKFFKSRKPRLTIGKNGVKVTAPSVSVGGKHARVNVSKKGVSTTTRVGRASYNSRRGCSLPLGVLLLLLAAAIAH